MGNNPATASAPGEAATNIVRVLSKRRTAADPTTELKQTGLVAHLDDKDEVGGLACANVNADGNRSLG